MDQYLVITAGWGPPGPLSATEALDPGSKAWQILPDIPTPRAGPSIIALSDGLLVASGGEYQGGGAFPTLKSVLLLEAN